MSDQEQIYPSSTKELAAERNAYAQTCGGLQSVYSERVCRRSTTRQNEAVDCRGRGPRDTVPVLHPRAYERRPSAWRDSGRDYGSHLGRR